MLAVNCLRMINELMSFSKLERKTDFDARNCYKKKKIATNPQQQQKKWRKRIKARSTIRSDVDITDFVLQR